MTLKVILRRYIVEVVNFIFHLIAIIIQPYQLWKIKRKDKVKICFLVSENQKWNCDSLYYHLSCNDRFDVKVVISKLDRDDEESYANNKAFFKNKGFHIEDGYDVKNHKYKSLKNYDLIFYQQPWNYSGVHKPEVTFLSSLLCYIPYGLMVANNDKSHYGIRFQKLLWKYFSPNTIISELFLSYNSIDVLLERFFHREKVVTLGHPKLDFFIDKKIPVLEKKRVIFAPHHSVDEWSTLKYATFEWSGLKVLELAKSDLTIDWVFKPHPRLKQALKENKIMSETEISAYFSAWEELPNCSLCDSGDYFDIFLNSSLLLTDCGSFLAEYLPTTKPIILLINDRSAGYNIFGQRLVRNYYKAHDVKELESHFNNIIYSEDDTMRSDRIECLNLYFNFKSNSGSLISSYIVKTL